MPYYRIVIWLKFQSNPVQGIRYIDMMNIEAVYRDMWSVGRGIYKHRFLDVEVQMLSHRCRAVRKYIWELEEKKRQMKVIYKAPDYASRVQSNTVATKNKLSVTPVQQNRDKGS
jgi:hypothetical protein